MTGHGASRAAAQPYVDGAGAAKAAPKPAHRPSRRHVIIEAAVRVFAQKGYVEASIQDIAEEAGMVATAVYYHFAGKDELFETALACVIEEMDVVTEQARTQGGRVSGETLPAVISAVWEWIEAHPNEAKLVYVHLPGATDQARLLSRSFEDRHLLRAFDYVGGNQDATERTAGEEHAATRLAVRTLIALLMSIHPMRLEDGPLNKRSSAGLRSGLVAVSRRLLSQDLAG